jgi:hypothetical protein
MSSRPKGVERLEQERAANATRKQTLARQRQADAQARADAELEELRAEQPRLRAEFYERRETKR